MAALTEEEIRASIAREWKAWPSAGWPSVSIEVEWSDAWTRIRGVAEHAYDLEDLRDSELARYDELTYQAVTAIEERVTREVIEAIVGAALTFAAEHPDAPRAKAPVEA
jgi:hypothetical protein